MKQPSHLTTSFLKPSFLMIPAIVLFLGAFSTDAAAAETSSRVASPAGETSSWTATAAVENTFPAGRDWIAQRSDNICGLSQTSQLTRPAKIDYDDVLAATPQMKRVRDERIDPSSAQGIRLRADAVRLVSQKCEEVRNSGGHCSVWKAIRHRDGRAITNVSDDVIALF